MSDIAGVHYVPIRRKGKPTRWYVYAWRGGPRIMTENEDIRTATERKQSGGRVVIMAPDGSLHGHGDIIAAADAYRVRPQDCAPIMRHILFGNRR